MPIQSLRPMSPMSLPAVDAAVKEDEWNALRNEAQSANNQETAGRREFRDQTEAAKFFKDIGEGYLERLETNPNAYAESWKMLKQEFDARGIDSSKMPPAGTSVDQLKKDFAKMVQIGEQGLAGRVPDPTYSQPVEGVNPETGANELYRPDSEGGLNPTGIGAPPPSSGVNIYTGDEKAQIAGKTEEQKALAKERVRQFGVINDAALAANETMDTIQTMRTLNFDGGPGTDLKNNARKFIMAIGGSEFVNVDEVSSVDAFTGLGFRELLNIMATQKGPQTDKDFERIQRTFAQSHNPDLTRKFLLDSAYARGARQVEMAGFYQNILESEGTLKNADRKWNAYKRSTPMLSDAVTDPETGMPVFYVDFKESLQQANPGVSDERILQEWRRLTGGK